MRKKWGLGGTIKSTKTATVPMKGGKGRGMVEEWSTRTTTRVSISEKDKDLITKRAKAK